MEGEGRTWYKVCGVFGLVVVWLMIFGRGRDKQFSSVVVVINDNKG